MEPQPLDSGFFIKTIIMIDLETQQEIMQIRTGKKEIFDLSEFVASPDKVLLDAEQFIIIPHSISMLDSMTDSEKLLFGIIASFYEYAGSCYASNKYLAKLTSTTIEIIKTRLYRMEKKSFISRKQEVINFPTGEKEVRVIIPDENLYEKQIYQRR